MLGRSGNPGYLRGYPLLMGTTATNGGITVDTDGFKLKGVNNDGTCQLLATDSYVDQPVSFLIILDYYLLRRLNIWLHLEDELH